MLNPGVSEQARSLILSKDQNSQYSDRVLKQAYFQYDQSLTYLRLLQTPEMASNISSDEKTEFLGSSLDLTQNEMVRAGGALIHFLIDHEFVKVANNSHISVNGVFPFTT